MGVGSNDFVVFVFVDVDCYIDWILLIFCMGNVGVGSVGFVVVDCGCVFGLVGRYLD